MSCLLTMIVLRCLRNRSRGHDLSRFLNDVSRISSWRILLRGNAPKSPPLTTILISVAWFAGIIWDNRDTDNSHSSDKDLYRISVNLRLRCHNSPLMGSMVMQYSAGLQSCFCGAEGCARLCTSLNVQRLRSAFFLVVVERCCVP